MTRVRRSVWLLARAFLRFLGARGGHETPEPRTLLNPPLRAPAYLNRHPGRTFLVLGNGASLKNHEAQIHAFIEKYDAVVLGANNITPFIYPDYHAFTNRKRFIAYADTIDSSRSKVLLGASFPETLVEEHYGGPYERIMYVADNHATFDIKGGVVQASCRTVANLLIAVAIVMGAKGTVYAAGIDGWTKKIDRGEQLSYYDETWLEHEDRTFFAEIERLSIGFLAQINEYLLTHGIGKLEILTPTVYDQYYRPIDELV